MSNCNSLMNLAFESSSGRATPTRASAQAGYAMAALLVGLSVMAVMLSIALPAWSHMVRREREEELIFRGNQYARAIALYQRTRANAFPTSVDQLIEQRLLRKKYKDPLSPNKDGEFQLIFQSQLKTQGQQPGAASRGTAFGSSASGGASTVGTPISTFQSTSGPIVGVVSKNTGTSIKTYKGKQKYSEWQFTSMEMTNQAGGGGIGGGAGRGGRDGRGGIDGRGGPDGRSGSGSRSGLSGAGRGGGQLPPPPR